MLHWKVLIINGLYTPFVYSAEPPPDSPCTLPLVEGTGSQKSQRFYFNAETETCVKFKYSGSGGNENNFETKEACEAACGFQPPGYWCLDNYCDYKIA